MGWDIPGASVNGDAGEELMPFGNPLMVMVTGPVNPFCGVTETITGEVVAPTCVETEASDNKILKSAAGGGGADGEPPHALRKHKLQMEINSNRNGFKLSPQDRFCYSLVRFALLRPR